MNKGILAMSLACAVAAFTLVGGAAVADASAKTYVCAYAKKAGNGETVYIVLTVKPREVGPSACKGFNSNFNGHHVSAQHTLGTGVVYCKYLYRTKSFQMVVAAFASTKRTGHGFCKAFHPTGKHWTKL